MEKGIIPMWYWMLVIKYCPDMWEPTCQNTLLEGTHLWLNPGVVKAEVAPNIDPSAVLGPQTKNCQTSDARFIYWTVRFDVEAQTWTTGGICWLVKCSKQALVINTGRRPLCRTSLPSILHTVWITFGTTATWRYDPCLLTCHVKRVYLLMVDCMSGRQ